MSFRSRPTDFSASFKIGVRVANATLDFLARHHDLELAILGFRDFGFGVGNFVLESLVSFVCLDRAALVAILAGAFFPLLDVELEFLSFFQRVDLSLFRRSDGSARPGQLGVEVENALRKRFELRAQAGDLLIDGLEVQKARNCRVHEGLW